MGRPGGSLGQGGKPVSLAVLLEDPGRSLGVKPGFGLSLSGRERGQALEDQGQDGQGQP
ncbi:hypothetical protein ACKLNZ_01180 [Thermus scotoductus]